MKSFLKFTFAAAVASLASLVAVQPASATTIITFGQTSSSNTATATATAGTTTITGTDIAVSITQIENGIATTGYLTFTLTSSGGAVTLFGNDLQQYSGSFDIFSGAGLTGTDYLSGTFTLGLFSGGDTGTGASFNVGQPPNTLFFTENGPITSTAIPVSFTLNFTNITPGLSITGNTIGSFTASVAGNASGSAVSAVPEPGSMMLLGSGLFGVAASVRRRLKAKR